GPARPLVFPHTRKQALPMRMRVRNLAPARRETFMTRSLALFVFLVVYASVIPTIAAEPASQYDRRWVYIPTSLVVQGNVGRVITLIERAGQAGYNGVVIADNSVNVLEKTYRDYRQNVELVRNAARRANIEIIPKIFSIGWSEGWLVHDPN